MSSKLETEPLKVILGKTYGITCTLDSGSKSLILYEANCIFCGAEIELEVKLHNTFVFPCCNTFFRPNKIIIDIEGVVVND